MKPIDQAGEPIVLHQKIQLPYRYTAGEANTAFLRGLQDRVILGSKCSTCDVLIVPAKPFCPGCSSTMDERVAVNQEGTLVSHTTDGDGRTIGLIQLDGATGHFPHIVDAPDVRTGMRVKARWATDRPAEITAIDAFEPI